MAFSQHNSLKKIISEFIEAECFRSESIRDASSSVNMPPVNFSHPVNVFYPCCLLCLPHRNLWVNFFARFSILAKSKERESSKEETADYGNLF